MRNLWSSPLPQWIKNIGLLLLAMIAVGLAWLLEPLMYSWIAHLPTGGPGIP